MIFENGVYRAETASELSELSARSKDAGGVIMTQRSLVSSIDQKINAVSSAVDSIKISVKPAQ